MASHRKARPPRTIHDSRRQLGDLYQIYQRAISYAVLLILTLATVALATYTVLST